MNKLPEQSFPDNIKLNRPTQEYIGLLHISIDSNNMEVQKRFNQVVNLDEDQTIAGEKTLSDDLTLDSGVLIIKETTTPTDVADRGKIYTKSDNKLYFQDGAGTEHEIAFV